MEKIKLFWENEKGKDILIVIIVILVGLGSFELGRLSKENAQEGLKIEYQSQNDEKGTPNSQIVNKPISSGKSFFASSKGSKYYTISCGAGKTIKQENRVYFATGEDAEQAGYELSSSCQ